MGDRGIIKVYQQNNYAPVYLYTHWRGSEIYGVVKRALSRRARWDECAYLTRIIFCELVAGEEGNETGFGISTFIPDNEHTIIGVNTESQMISFEERDGSGRVKFEMSFEDFINRKDKYSKLEQHEL